MPTPTRLSLLDRSRTRDSEPDAVALQRTIARVKRLFADEGVVGVRAALVG